MSSDLENEEWAGLPSNIERNINKYYELIKPDSKIFPNVEEELKKWEKTKDQEKESNKDEGERTNVDEKNDEEDGNLLLSDLTPDDNVYLNKLVEKSKTSNKINYLSDSIYTKFVNNVEFAFWLPAQALRCIMSVESGWYMYNKSGSIKWSSAWAQWLFQLMPSTADLYMKNKKVLEYCWVKKFKSRNEFIKNPLATAVAAGVIMSTYMKTYNFQTALACYNWWLGNYEKHIENKKGKRNLTKADFSKLPEETRLYIPSVTMGVLKSNPEETLKKEEAKELVKKNEKIDEVLADLWKYSRNKDWNSMA